MTNVLLHHPQNLLLQGHRNFSNTRLTKVQGLGYSCLDIPSSGALSAHSMPFVKLHGRTQERLVFVRLISDNTGGSSSDDENSDEEKTFPDKNNEARGGLSRENLERIVGQGDSAFSGVDLARLIRNKYDVQLIKKRCRDITTIPLRRKKHTAVTCCLLPALNSSSVSLAAATNLKHTPIPSGIMQKIASTCIHCLIMADLDSETAKLLIGIASPFLSTFSFLFIIRIVMSWYPKLPVDKFPYVIAYAPTEPFLLVTRKVLPPLGGVDVTPVVWFGLVSFLNEILVGPQGLLVLLSQKV